MRSKNTFQVVVAATVAGSKFERWYTRHNAYYTKTLREANALQFVTMTAGSKQGRATEFTQTQRPRKTLCRANVLRFVIAQEQRTTSMRWRDTFHPAAGLRRQADRRRAEHLPQKMFHLFNSITPCTYSYWYRLPTDLERANSTSNTNSTTTLLLVCSQSPVYFLVPSQTISPRSGRVLDPLEGVFFDHIRRAAAMSRHMGESYQPNEQTSGSLHIEHRSLTSCGHLVAML